jgi:hypothetical protein
VAGEVVAPGLVRVAEDWAVGRSVRVRLEG